MIQVSLVRHGSTDPVNKVLCGRVVDPDLNAQGRAEALDAATRLGAVDAVFSSPRRRTLETAAFIRSAAPPAVDARLDEIDFGAWAGRTFDALAPDPQWQRWNATRDLARPPGGENFDDVADRVLAWVGDLRRGDWTAVAAVTHCDVVRALLCRLLGLSPRDWARIEVDCGSITTIAVEGTAVRVLRWKEA